jgi:hypothetical protein
MTSLSTYQYHFDDNQAQLRFNETVTSWGPLEPGGGGERVEEIKNDDENHSNKQIYKVVTSDNDGNTIVYYTYKIVLSVGPWGPELYGRWGDIYIWIYVSVFNC